MKLEKFEPVRFQRQLPSIYSDPTIVSRNLTPFSREESDHSRNVIKPLSPYMAEIKRTRNFNTIDLRRPSPNRNFRIHEHMNKQRPRDLSQPTMISHEPRNLATIYLPRNRSPLQQSNIHLPLTTLYKNDRVFRRTKFLNGSMHEQAHTTTVANILNPDNLRKLAYTVATNKPANQSNQQPPKQEDNMLHRKKFRQNKYVCSDEVKHTIAGSLENKKEEVDYQNLLDYVDQDNELPSRNFPAYGDSTNIRVDEDWPDKHRSVSQIEMQLCRFGSHAINGSPDSPPTERDDFVSELSQPKNTRQNFCADFTFQVSNNHREQKKQLRWSQIS